IPEVVPHQRDFPAVVLRVPGEVLQVLAVVVRPGRQHGREYRVVPHDRGSEAHGLPILGVLLEVDRCRAHFAPPFLPPIFSAAFARISTTRVLSDIPRSTASCLRTLCASWGTFRICHFIASYYT